MSKDKLLDQKLEQISQSIPDYVEIGDLKKIIRISQYAIEDYAKCKLETFISEHLPEYSLTNINV